MRILYRVFHFTKALFSVCLFGYPARSLNVIAVTGTDGKTTTVSLIYHILKTAGRKVSMISTVSAIIGGKKIETGLHTTTPSSYQTQKLLKKMLEKKSEFAVLEATSHGITQYRLFGTNIRVAVLTNITHEHFDYHGNFKNYLLAKAKIFRKAKVAVLNTEDKSFGKIKRMLSRNTKIIAYPNNHLEKGLLTAIQNRFKEPYNRLNAEAVISAVKIFGIKNEDIIMALSTFAAPAGRMEEIKNMRGFKVFIDFAHTPNALQNLLTFLKSTSKGKLITVFGCAGERDKSKRAPMGEISARIADLSIFTAEDPRRENVNSIIEEMIKGAKKAKGKFIKISDRKEAINYAINTSAQKGDTVVICGKGHEKSMAFGKKEYPWSDYQTVKTLLRGKQ